MAIQNNDAKALETSLVPFSDFQKVAAQILSVSKEESDEQMQRFQAENPRGKAKKSKPEKSKKTA